MSTRHVSNSESDSPFEFDDRLPLPAPSTTNNLLPRFAITALSRHRSNRSFMLGASSHPDDSGSSSRNGNLRSSSRQRREIMQTATGQTQNRGGSSRPSKRRRTRNNNFIRRRSAREGWATPDGDEDEVDQLTSDTDNGSLPPPSQSVGQSSQQTVESQSTSAIGSSTDIGTLPQATSRSSVSSPSLAKILHPVNIEQTPAPSTSVSASSSSSIDPAPTKLSHRSKPNPKSDGPEPPPSPEREHELLSAYTCPICFFPPTNATLTPCGHICCGSCLFTAIKTTMQRGVATSEGSVARCPVCRAEINKWDGKGGGVIGLKPRAVFSL